MPKIFFKKKKSITNLDKVLKQFENEEWDAIESLLPLFLLFSDKPKIARDVTKQMDKFLITRVDLELYCQLAITTLTNNAEQNHISTITTLFKEKKGIELCLKRLECETGETLFAALERINTQEDESPLFTPKKLKEIKANYLLLLLANHLEFTETMFSNIKLCEEIFDNFIFNADIELDKETVKQYLNGLVEYNQKTKKPLPNLIIQHLFQLSKINQSEMYSTNLPFLPSDLFFSYYNGLEKEQKLELVAIFKSNAEIINAFSEIIKATSARWVIHFFQADFLNEIFEKVNSKELFLICSSIVATKNIRMIESLCSVEFFNKKLPIELIVEIRKIINNELNYNTIVEADITIARQFIVSDFLINKTEEQLEQLNKLNLLTEPEFKHITDLHSGVEKGKIKKEWLELHKTLANIIFEAFMEDFYSDSHFYLLHLKTIRQDYIKTLIHRVATLDEDCYNPKHYTLDCFPQKMIQNMPEEKKQQIEVLLNQMNVCYIQHTLLKNQPPQIDFYNFHKLIINLIKEKSPVALKEFKLQKLASAFEARFIERLSWNWGLNKASNVPESFKKDICNLQLGNNNQIYINGNYARLLERCLSGLTHEDWNDERLYKSIVCEPARLFEILIIEMLSEQETVNNSVSSPKLF